MLFILGSTLIKTGKDMINFTKAFQIGLILKGKTHTDIANSAGVDLCVISGWKKYSWENLKQHHKDAILKGLDATESDLERWSNVH